ncbi:hypothetical protein [Bifidobacterium pseudolongum]|uniref:Uncharacterized protein n=1 Tax=Bifidobacterium pseudolongum subsp. globosum TaxID=1690 RepID=A0A4Q5A3A3_9BIFI|nr:hypothetical protein [Bifidobacterium pseudolongum]RYQ16992.1 hypothetical protein PG2071B_1569 [Bifidobacterium pseudolongum subsp. globosum]
MNATWIGTPNYEPGRRGQKVDHITLHIMAGFLAGTIVFGTITWPCASAGYTKSVY